MKITLGQAKPIVARVLNLCGDDDRVTDYINRAIERLMEEGDWVGTTSRFYINAIENIVTLPRGFERITGYMVDNTPGQIRNRWYEFNESGPGLATDLTMRSQCIDRGLAVGFDEVLGDNKKLAVYNESAESSGLTLKVTMTDCNGNPVKETINIGTTAATYVYSTATCAEGALEHVVKSETDGAIYLYEYDPTTTVKRLLAYYEADETVPQYRRYFVPGIENYSTPTTLTMEAKKAYQPAVEDDAPLLIQSLEALRLACQAIAKEEKDLLADAQMYWYGGFDERIGRRSTGAVPILQAQLKNHQGPGQVVPIRIATPALFGAGGVNNVV